MPRVPQLEGVTGRCFARVDYFECACPNCGRIIQPTRQRKHRKHSKLTEQGRRRIYNVHTQLLWCPWCESSFVVGLLLFPTRQHVRRPLDAPIDARPTRAERLEMARLGGGYLMEERYREGETHVNRIVQAPCSCPPHGWVDSCPVHAQP
jgi:hypothetical protein